ncbi:hypothetical protein BHM03_00015035 [Ensete ventricosum]|nr:hypothetical protein BHM03_00015035 [Ensete ventricosum]
MVDSMLKKDHIVTKASAIPELPGALDDGTIAIDIEAPEGQLRTLDLWAEILINRDSEWEEAEDIRPTRETIGEKGRR